MDDRILYSQHNNRCAGYKRNNRTAGAIRPAVKVNTALRATRRAAYALYLLIVWYAASGWYSLGFAACMIIAVTLIWQLWRWVLIVSAKRGKIYFKNIF